MFSKRRSSKLGGVWFSLGGVAVLWLALSGLWPRIGMWPSAVILGSAVIGFYFAGKWYFERPSELDKRIPISGEERRRREKEFFDSLASRGRR